jgi:hypothetical protein
MASEELKRLEDSRDVLKASVAYLGNWLIVFIVAVVIGLGIELYRPITSLIKQFELVVLVELIGTALVTIGVAGELFVEWKTHRKEKELLRIDAVIEREDKETIGQLNLSLSASNERIAELQLQAEQERLARVQIEERMRHADSRKLNEYEIASLRAAVRPFSGQLFWIITQTNDHRSDSEAILFAKQLESILTSEGWVSDDGHLGGQRYRQIASSGVEVSSGAGEQARRAATAIEDALVSFHINMRPSAIYPNIALTLVLIDIGLN